jgi:hypothetical protein
MTQAVEPAAVGTSQPGPLLGDMDGSGDAGVADAISILRIVVGLDATSPYADVSQDGAVGVNDAIELLRALVGLGSWPFAWQIATVAGHVAELTSDNGLQGIDVTIGGQTGATDAAGNYSIGGVPIGDQAISVADDDYDVAGALPATVAVAAPETALGTIYMLPDDLSPPPGPED